MLTMLLHRAPSRGFYSVEVMDNLFGEYTVQREWGRLGRSMGHRTAWFGNLREAVQAADRWRGRAQSRGYRMTERRIAKV